MSQPTWNGVPLARFLASCPPSDPAEWVTCGACKAAPLATSGACTSALCRRAPSTPEIPMRRQRRTGGRVQRAVLVELRGGEATVSQLGGWVERSPEALRPVLRTLEGRGYVVRERQSGGDLWEITDAGLDLLRARRAS